MSSHTTDLSVYAKSSRPRNDSNVGDRQTIILTLAGLVGLRVLEMRTFDYFEFGRHHD